MIKWTYMNVNFLSCPSGWKSCFPINYLSSRAIGRMELFTNIAPIFERCRCSISAVGLFFPKPFFSIPLSGGTLYSFYSVSISVDVNSCSVYIDKRIYIVYFRNTPFIDVNCSVSDFGTSTSWIRNRCDPWCLQRKTFTLCFDLSFSQHENNWFH